MVYRFREEMVQRRDTVVPRSDSLEKIWFKEDMVQRRNGSEKR